MSRARRGGGRLGCRGWSCGRGGTSPLRRRDAPGETTGAREAPLQTSLAAFLAGAAVLKAFRQGGEGDGGQADLLNLTEPTRARDPRHVQEIVHQPRQVEDQRHPMVQVGGVELVAEDL